MAAWAVGDVVVVLGAGASRGAEWVTNVVANLGEAATAPDLPPMCLPPLNADFFTQLQRITTKRHQSTIQLVLDDVLELYGSDFQLTLEQYFTQLEAMIAALEVGSSSAATFKVSELQTKRTNLGSHGN